ncbi:hypothetical protein [Methylobacterium isbiliense]|uniref:Bacteriophage tail tape measure N-terminal domain-containing protein n=1 Tax=Methylobacterium isbiliense TaxID=315478 RepID=A0ABQ4S8J9_9HYPH|nr:hypothetical protein [Methylobacterium isbiliense]MDN3622013.1 hypothetical protein [Methylobacterium isbiliense]GJD99474.1 hypothetical protein GMJLKIPL_1392 [Methylobacterium isbiliense]
MAERAALSFDITANVSNFQRGMQLVTDTAKQRAAQFALEFTGASRTAEMALSNFAKRSGSEITKSITAAAVNARQSLIATASPAAYAAGQQVVQVGAPIAGAALSGAASGAGSLAAAGALSLVRNIAPYVAAYATIKVSLEAVQATAKAAMDALDGVNKIGTESARLGVSTDFYQRWTNSAHELKVEAKDLTAALEQAYRAFIVMQGTEKPNAEGAGGNQSAFERQLRAQVRAGNAPAESVPRFLGSATDEDKLRTALEIMEGMYRAGAQIAALDLASKLMPESIVDRLRSGSLEFRDLLRSATDLGNLNLVVVKAEDVTRAQELKRRLEEAENTLANVGRQFNTDLARAGMTLTDAAIAWKEILAQGASIALNAFRGMQAAAREFQQGGAGLSSGPRAPSIAAQLGALAPGQSRTGPAADAGMQDALDKMRGSMNPTTIAAAQRASKSVTDLFFGDKTKPLITTTPRSSSSESIDAVESFTRSLEKQVAGLKAEADAFNKSTAEKQRAVQLARAVEVAQQAGIKLSDEQIARINKAADAYGHAKDRIAALEQQQQLAAQAAQYFGQALSDSIADALIDGQKLSDVLHNLSRQLARMALQGLLTGTGPLAGLLGTAAPATESGAGTLGGLFGGALSFFRGGGGAAMAAASAPVVLSDGALLLHDGGRVGDPGIPRVRVDPRIFHDAPRYHTGLASNEFAAVLQEGETVLTERQTDMVRGSLSGVRSGGGGQKAVTDARSFAFDMRGSTLTEAEVRAMFMQVLSAYDSEANRTLGQRMANWRENN